MCSLPGLPRLQKKVKKLKISVSKRKSSKVSLPRASQLTWKRVLHQQKVPFLSDTTQKLASNRYVAKKIYFGQIRKLNMRPMDKKETIASENKLQELGFLDFVNNVTVEQQNKM